MPIGSVSGCGEGTDVRFAREAIASLDMIGPGSVRAPEAQVTDRLMREARAVTDFRRSREGSPVPSVTTPATLGRHRHRPSARTAELPDFGWPPGCHCLYPQPGHERNLMTEVLPRLRRIARAGLLTSARDETDAVAGRSALVLAPHPDDETLGCGA